MGAQVREIIFLGVFCLLVFVTPIFIAWLSYSDRSRIDMRSLWTHHGRIDKFAIMVVFTWWVHTSSMILWTLMEKVVTADYLTYMGWALPLVAKMFAPGAEPQPNGGELNPDPKGKP